MEIYHKIIIQIWIVLVIHFWMKFFQHNNHLQSGHLLLDKDFTTSNHPNLDGSSHVATNLVHLPGGCEQ